MAKVDGKTGKLTDFPIRMPNGKAALAHGIFLDTHDGKLYFNASPKIAYLDGTSASSIRRWRVEAFSPPEGMSRVSGWLGGDAKGFVWAASGTMKKGGALPLDPRTKMFKQFDSPTAGLTYGIAGDKDGNGWWMGVNDDIIVFGNPSTGEISEIKLPPQPLAEFLKPGDLGEGKRFPAGLGGNQSPRRPYADLNGKDLWVTELPRQHRHPHRHGYQGAEVLLGALPGDEPVRSAGGQQAQALGVVPELGRDWSFRSGYGEVDALQLADEGRSAA